MSKDVLDDLIATEDYLNDDGVRAPSSCTSGPTCSVMPSFIVEAGLGQFGVRETENDCRVIARCDMFDDAMRIARLLVAETSPND